MSFAVNEHVSWVFVVNNHGPQNTDENEQIAVTEHSLMFIR